MKESDIEKAFVAYAESRGCRALKLRIDGENGFPDRSVITPNGILFIEFKRPKGKLRAAQKLWQLTLDSMGFNVLVPTKIGEAEAFLAEYLR
jgi:hypothetical protein